MELKKGKRRNKNKVEAITKWEEKNQIKSQSDPIVVQILLQTSGIEWAINVFCMTSVASNDVTMLLYPEFITGRS